MAYADKLGIPFVVFLGEDEIAAGKCALKDMRSGEQELVTTEEAIAKLQTELAELSAKAVIVEK